MSKNIIENQPELHPLCQAIEHTLLKADATKEDVIKLCEEAINNQFVAVCVSPYYVQLAKKTIKKAPTKIVTVVGFPMGYSATSSKVEETKKAIMSGADEVDVVMNISALKAGDIASVQNDIQAVVTACHLQNTLCKVIIETAYLNETELEQALRFCVDAEADYVKTSTGYAPEGANVDTVKKMRQLLPPKVKIKASGGIKDAAFAEALLAAGASRIGTSSGLQLIAVEA